MSAQAGLAWIPSGSVGQGLVAPSWPSGWGWGVGTWSLGGRPQSMARDKAQHRGQAVLPSGPPQPFRRPPRHHPSLPQGLPHLPGSGGLLLCSCTWGPLWETGLARTEGRGPLCRTPIPPPNRPPQAPSAPPASPSVCPVSPPRSVRTLDSSCQPPRSPWDTQSHFPP